MRRARVGPDTAGSESCEIGHAMAFARVPFSRSEVEAELASPTFFDVFVVLTVAFLHPRCVAGRASRRCQRGLRSHSTPMLRRFRRNYRWCSPNHLGSGLAYTRRY